MKRISIRKGGRVAHYAIVDDEDYEALNMRRWSLGTDGYAYRYTYKNGKPKRLAMHRAVLNAPDGTIADHINLNRLDNRRRNLRLATAADNARNVRKRSTNKSGFKGVKFWKNRYMSSLTFQGRSVYMGRYETAEEAAWMYDQWASQLFGDFAVLNFDYS